MDEPAGRFVLRVSAAMAPTAVALVWCFVRAPVGVDVEEGGRLLAFAAGFAGCRTKRQVATAGAQIQSGWESTGMDVCGSGIDRSRTDWTRRLRDVSRVGNVGGGRCGAMTALSSVQRHCASAGRQHEQGLDTILCEWLP